MIPPSADATAAARLHDELQAWLMQTHPREPVMVVVAALTFEIGRVVALSDADIATAVNTVCETLRDQIRAHRDGQLAP